MLKSTVLLLSLITLSEASINYNGIINFVIISILAWLIFKSTRNGWSFFYLVSIVFLNPYFKFEIEYEPYRLACGLISAIFFVDILVNDYKISLISFFRSLITFLVRFKIRIAQLLLLSSVLSLAYIGLGELKRKHELEDIKKQEALAEVKRKERDSIEAAELKQRLKVKGHMIFMEMKKLDEQNAIVKGKFCKKEHFIKHLKEYLKFNNPEWSICSKLNFEFSDCELRFSTTIRETYGIPEPLTGSVKLVSSSFRSVYPHLSSLSRRPDIIINHVVRGYGNPDTLDLYQIINKDGNCEIVFSKYPKGFQVPSVYFYN
jgi:hypothetical protein